MGLGDWWTDGRWTGWEADPLTGHKVGQISSPRGLSTIFLISETRLFFLKGSRCSKSENRNRCDMQPNRRWFDETGASGLWESKVTSINENQRKTKWINTIWREKGERKQKQKKGKERGEREGAPGAPARFARVGPQSSLPSFFFLQIVLIYLVVLRFSKILVTFSTQNVAQTKKTSIIPEV